jgi:hypothetical protein
LLSILPPCLCFMPPLPLTLIFRHFDADDIIFAIISY